MSNPVGHHEEPKMSAIEAWRNEAVSGLFEAVLRLETADETSAFFRDLCTLGELHDMAQRWAVVRLLDAGMHYAEISNRTGASTATITRIAQWLHHGEGGYTAALARLHNAQAGAPNQTEAPGQAPTPTEETR
jgi:TrpR-related protein YerC/YecD